MYGYNYNNYNRWAQVPGGSGNYASQTIAADQARADEALANYNTQWNAWSQSKSFAAPAELTEAQAELNAANAQLGADQRAQYGMATTIGTSLAQAVPFATFQANAWDGVRMG